MKNNYLAHYARVNNIDLSSESSIRDWFKNGATGLKLELGKYVSNLKDKAILDLGCGVGSLLNYLIINDCTNILGVDNSTEQLELCKKFVTDKVIEDDIFNFLLTTIDKYDFIIVFDILEHIKKERVFEFLKLVYDALNRNGEILIRTPNMSSLTGLHIRYDDFTHEVGFTSESLIQILETVGFSKIVTSNTYLGNKRRFIMKILYKLVYKLHFLTPPEVMTLNILAKAKK
jgi:2-polyprenyl-3-methyl-5-hydroxy-6-metoxy-1,4-benzoquinol methylase